MNPYSLSYGTQGSYALPLLPVIRLLVRINKLYKHIHTIQSYPQQPVSSPALPTIEKPDLYGASPLSHPAAHTRAHLSIDAVSLLTNLLAVLPNKQTQALGNAITEGLKKVMV